VGSDELLAFDISHLEQLEDLEKDRALVFNNNDVNSGTPKANPHGSHPSLAPLPVNKDNFSYGLTPNLASGQYPQFQPNRPNMTAPVRPVLWSWCPINLCQFLSCQIIWSLLFLIQSIMLDLIIVRQEMHRPPKILFRTMYLKVKG
jgi:hypothetical protein